MGAFHVFYIVQMVKNCATSHTLTNSNAIFLRNIYVIFKSVITFKLNIEIKSFSRGVFRT